MESDGGNPSILIRVADIINDAEISTRHGGGLLEAANLSRLDSGASSPPTIISSDAWQKRGELM